MVVRVSKLHEKMWEVVRRKICSAQFQVQGKVAAKSKRNAGQVRRQIQKLVSKEKAKRKKLAAWASTKNSEDMRNLLVGERF